VRDSVVNALGSAPPLMREHVGRRGERVQRFYRPTYVPVRRPERVVRLPERVVVTLGRVTNTTEFDLDDVGQYTGKHQLTARAHIPGMEVLFRNRVYGTRSHTHGRNPIFVHQLFVNDVLYEETSNVANDVHTITERLWFPNGQLQYEGIQTWEGEPLQEKHWSYDGTIIPFGEVDEHQPDVHAQIHGALSPAEMHVLFHVNANYALEYRHIEFVGMSS
jgi:hypothetical protein